GRKRRFQPRLPAPALERAEQAGLFAADVGARAAVDRDLLAILRTEDVLADVPSRLRLLQGGVQDVVPPLELAANVDEGLRAAGRVRREEDPLDQLVRVVLNQHFV